MGKMIFQVYLAKRDSPSEAYAELELPATPWELVDAMDKVRLQEGEKLFMEVTRYYGFGRLAPFLDDINPSLNELNALAEQLSPMGSMDRIAFDGLLQIKIDQRPKRITMQDLRDLAASVDCCNVAGDVLDDEQLGKFYAENGFIPELDGLPDKVYELLDFELLGRRMREGECGVFTEQGYVVQDQDLEQAPPVPREITQPEYTILLELTKGHFNDPAYDNDQIVLLKLPSDARTMDRALDTLGAASWSEVNWRCVDCKAPSLMEAVSEAVSIAHINRLAEHLTRMGAEEISSYKAVLAATGCGEIIEATLLIDQMEQYIVDPKTASPQDVAMGELRTMLDNDSMELILPHLNLYPYGQALLQRYNSTLTEYGLVERRDMQPIQKITDAPVQDGMEITM